MGGKYLPRTLAANFMFELLFLPFRVLNIFAGFTFTDAEDFAPLLSLIIGLAVAFSLRRSTREKASFPLVATMILLSLWPILPNFGRLLMALELQAVAGRWPQVMVDDPKNLLGHISPRFDAFFHLVNYFEAFSGAWMVVFVALFLVTQRQFSRWQRKVFSGLAAICILLILLDPGQLYEWWLD